MKHDFLIVAVSLAAAPMVMAQDVAPVPPLTMTLHAAYFDMERTVFIDTASLRRNGDLVEGWDLTVYPAPQLIGPGKFTDMYWRPFRISCSQRFVALSWVISRKPASSSFTMPFDIKAPITPTNGWARPYAYACDKAAIFKAKPHASEAAAAKLARELMAAER